MKVRREVLGDEQRRCGGRKNNGRHRRLPGSDHPLWWGEICARPGLDRRMRSCMTSDSALLDAYSDTCLRSVWRAEHFSWWMTSMLHRHGDDPFESRLKLSRLEYVCSSRAAATSLAENYVDSASS